MKQKIFAVCDAEEEYVTQLTRYLCNQAAVPFDVYGYTRVSELEELSSKEGEISILLVGESLCDEAILNLPIHNLYCLQEGLKETESLGKPIDKYQPVEEILRIVFEEYGEGEGERKGFVVNKTGRLKLIGMYSPIGRCLQTTFAITFGQILSRQKKVLYLNFEGYSGFSELMRNHNNLDLSDLIYYFQNTPDKLPLKLGQLVKNVNGLDVVPPVINNHDLGEITSSEFLNLVTLIDSKTDYDVLILDLSDFQKAVYEILAKCDVVYTIVKNDRIAKAKINQYEEMLRLMDMEEITVKTKKLDLPLFRELPAYMEQYTYGDLASFAKDIVQELGDLWT